MRMLSIPTNLVLEVTRGKREWGSYPLPGLIGLEKSMPLSAHLEAEAMEGIGVNVHTWDWWYSISIYIGRAFGDFLPFVEFKYLMNINEREEAESHQFILSVGIKKC